MTVKLGKRFRKKHYKNYDKTQVINCKSGLLSDFTFTNHSLITVIPCTSGKMIYNSVQLTFNIHNNKGIFILCFSPKFLIDVFKTHLSIGKNKRTLIRENVANVRRRVSGIIQVKSSPYHKFSKTETYR